MSNESIAKLVKKLKAEGEAQLKIDLAKFDLEQEVQNIEAHGTAKYQLKGRRIIVTPVTQGWGMSTYYPTEALAEQVYNHIMEGKR